MRPVEKKDYYKDIIILWQIYMNSIILVHCESSFPFNVLFAIYFIIQHILAGGTELWHMSELLSQILDQYLS